MFVIAFEIGDKTYYLKNHALAALGCLIDEPNKTEVVVFEDKAEAQEVCRLFKNAKIKEERIDYEG